MKFLLTIILLLIGLTAQAQGRVTVLTDTNGALLTPSLAKFISANHLVSSTNGSQISGANLVTTNDLSNAATAWLGQAAAAATNFTTTNLTMISILQFGADATGVTNCHDALQQAINAAHAKGGGTVVIPSGNYRLNAGYAVNGWPGVNLRGEGGIIWVSLPDSYNRTNDFITGWNTSRTVTVTEPYIDAAGNTNSSWTSSPSIYPWNGKCGLFQGFSNCIVENLTIDGGWGVNSLLSRPASVLPITGVTSIIGGGSSDEFTFYQGFAWPSHVRFTGCRFYNFPGAIISGPSYCTIADNDFSDFGDHLVYIRSGMSAVAAAGNTITGNRCIATRATVGSPGTFPYTSSPPSSDFVGSTLRDAFKVQSAPNTVITGNTVQTIDAAFATVEVFPRQDNTDPSSWVDCDHVTLSDNSFTGNAFLLLGASRRGNNDHAVKSIANNTQGQKIRNLVVSGNVITLVAATNWNGGAGKLIAVTRSAPSYGSDYGAAVSGMLFTRNQVSGNWYSILAGNPEYVSPLENITISGNNLVSAISIGMWDLSGNVGSIFFNGNYFAQSTTNTTTSQAVVRYFDTLPCWGQVVLANNTAVNMSRWIEDFTGGSSAAYADTTTYSYSTNLFDDQVVTNYSLARSISGELYINTTTTTGGGDPATNANWQVYARPVVDWKLVNNGKFCPVPSLSATDRAGFLVESYTSSSAAMKSIWRVTHSGNINVGMPGDSAAYSLSTPTDASTRLMGVTPTLNGANPLGLAAYVDNVNNRLGVGCNLLTPQEPLDIQATRTLVGADNATGTNRTAGLQKSWNLYLSSPWGTSTAENTNVYLFQAVADPSYSQLNIGGVSGSKYALGSINLYANSTAYATAGGTTPTLAVVGSQVAIMAASPASSAALDVTSTFRGFLAPRMTQSQRSAISSPANGLHVFQTDGTPAPWWYSSTASAWVNAAGSTNGLVDTAALTTASNGIVAMIDTNVYVAQLSRFVTNSTTPYAPNTVMTNWGTLTTSGGYAGSVISGTLTNTLAGWHEISWFTTLNVGGSSRVILYTNGVSTGLAAPGYYSTDTSTGYDRGVWMTVHLYLPASTACNLESPVGTAWQSGVFTLKKDR